MSRKIINIDFSKCPLMQSTLLERANCLDLCEKIVPTKEGLCSTKNYIVPLVKESIEKYHTYTIELFGKLELRAEEIAGIEYLQKLIK